MNTIVVVMRSDQKLYPPRPRSAAEIAEIRALEHSLHCGQGLSFRATQAALLDRHGVRRSLGMVHRDLTDYKCPYCLPKPPPPPDPAQKARAYAWR